MLKKKVKAVLKIYNHLEKETNKFLSVSALSCKPGCGACCTFPEIFATPIEFLPYALYLYELGIAEEYLDGLKGNEFTKTCVLFSQNQLKNGPGGCLHYEFRALTCRIFGFSSKILKNGTRNLITCKIIKNEYPEMFDGAEKTLKKLSLAPVAANYYPQLAAIDYVLSEQQLPVNSAILKALEAVLAFYSYRRKKVPPD